MFYVVKKPLWVSSNLVAKILKRVLNTPKIGFAGTLDPLATGLMIIGTEGSPRLFPLTENFSKTYTTTIRLDGTTASYDLEQPVEKIEVNKKIQDAITLPFLHSVIDEFFTGDVWQIPPTYSAVWIDGQRAYTLARKWETVDIKPKKRTIHSFDIISYSWPTIDAKITVSHGTYIRSIARDLWHHLKTGGYIEKLERISIGSITMENVEWSQHNDIYYAQLSHEKLFPNIPVLDITSEQKKHLRLGSTPLVTDEKDGHYFVIYENDSYGLLEAKWGLLFPIKNAV
jgi:tRNA pseudouridine55 synthase